MTKEIEEMAIRAYNQRSEDLKDFVSCVIIDNNLPVVVTQNVIINFYYDYLYHPDIGLQPISNDLDNLTCKDAINYLSGNGCDVRKRKAQILKSKKSKRLSPRPHTKSKRTQPRPSKKSKRTK